MTTIELVRHGEALPRDTWGDRPDRDRPLTERGLQQAQALARELLAGPGPLDALYSSPSRRCVASLEPLAAATGLPIVTEAGLSEVATVPLSDGGNAWVSSAWLGGHALALVERVVAEHPHGRAVLCSHGDVIPALLAVLAGRDRLALPDVRLAKGARITLDWRDGRCSLARPTDRGRV